MIRHWFLPRNVRTPALRQASVLVLLAAAFLPSATATDLLSELDAEQRASLVRGEQVFVGEPVEGCPWPRASVYRCVEASPEETMAVFFDFASASTYIPNVERSVVAKVIDPWKMEVNYELSIPLLPNETYTALNTLGRRGERFSVKWKVLRSRSIRSSEGEFQVEPHAAGSIIRYRNLVHPGSRFAGILRGPAMKQVEATVTAITDEVRSQKTNHPKQLREQVTRLRSAVDALENAPLEARR